MQNNQKAQDIIEALALVKMPGGEMSARIAASRIVATALPNSSGSPGSCFYRLKAEDWISLVLASEPGMTLIQLAERVQALGSVSEKIKNELGGIPGRLHSLATKQEREPATTGIS